MLFNAEQIISPTFGKCVVGDLDVPVCVYASIWRVVCLRVRASVCACVCVGSRLVSEADESSDGQLGSCA